MAEEEKTDELQGMEITSPRTAEQPGPILPETPKDPKVHTHDPDCCQTDPQPSSHNHGHEHDEELSYLPAIISLVLLLSGLALNYFQVS